eukprot:3747140-Pyramimonas_sp.AAC.1
MPLHGLPGQPCCLHLRALVRVAPVPPGAQAHGALAYRQPALRVFIRSGCSASCSLRGGKLPSPTPA